MTRTLVSDPIEVTIPAKMRPGLNGPLHQIWRPCSRKHREYIQAGLLPVSCSKCTHERRAPRRIQMTRQRPWRADHPDAVIVARPSKWGNAFRIVRAGSCHVGPAVRSQWRNGPHWHVVWPDGGSWCFPTREEAARRAVELYQVDARVAPVTETIRVQLAGRDLACWCPPDQPCHADVLLELANGDQP